MPNHVGKNIKRLREDKGISQNTLAKLSGVSQSAISSIESTTKSPSIDTVFLIADALGVPIVDILFDEVEKEMPASINGGRQEEVVKLLMELSQDDLEHVRDFVAGLKASRAK